MVYDDLTPQRVLDALDAVGLRGDGRILQLNSYENRVFQVFLDDGRVVVAKFYRPGRWSDEQILEEHAFALELAEAEVPVVPPLVLASGTQSGAGPAEPPPQLLGQPPTLARAGSHRYSAALRCAGREPELDQPGVLQRLGAFIGRLHAVGRRQAFAHRHRLAPAVDGRRAIDLLLNGGFVPAEQAGAWQRAAEEALAALTTAWAGAEASAPLATLRLHGDCHIGNILWREHASDTAEGPSTRGAHVVDLDDAMQGPAVQDVWMLASGDSEAQHRRLDALLEGYETHSAFDWRERTLIEPLRTLRMLRHSAWLAERWADPTFPIHFPFFGSAAYWSQQTAQLREQLELMDR
ncbi:MAG: serine/threonine protein kinase [Rubrivivax sp.]|nr:serine/threonine protein kinase [Rubrivivax sp.]